MKIVMVGHSGVGKTTFMACMYAVLQTPVEGFSIIADFEDMHGRLLAMARAVVNGAYPPATTALSNYQLTLLFNDDGVLDFEWIDYRGNALNESGSSYDVAELQEELEEADGAIIFFDGVELERGGRSARSAIGRVMVFLQNAIAHREGIFPVALVITKADLIEDANAAVEPLEPLGQAIAESRTVHGALIFTACGKDTLVNVSAPTLFALHKGIIGKIARMRAALEESIEEAQRFRNNENFFNWLGSRLDGVPTWGDRADRKLYEAQSLIEQHDALVDPANELASALQDITMF